MKLKNQGINLLTTFFDDDVEKKAIRAKFGNISGKTGQYFVPDYLWQKRTHRKNRVLIPFEHVKLNNLTIEQLQKFEGGVAVEFTNLDFFNELDSNEELQHPVFLNLKDKLGSDDVVSAIIVIRSTGSSSSSEQREAYKRLIDYLHDKNLILKDCLLRRKNSDETLIDYAGIGNEHWTGFVYYKISGGQQEAIDSHNDYRILSSNVQLFNPSVEYASEDVAEDITLVLIYFALHSIDEGSRTESWRAYIRNLEVYLKNRVYQESSLYSYVNTHISLNLEKGYLVDPIQVKKIQLKDFILKNREPNAIDLTHESSVNKQEYFYDSSLNKILTPARPNNVFWSTHLSNMMQQDFTLNEYFQHQRENIKKWDQYNIDRSIK